jgi:hypothetical protein
MQAASIFVSSCCPPNVRASFVVVIEPLPTLAKLSSGPAAKIVRAHEKHSIANIIKAADTTRAPVITAP